MKNDKKQPTTPAFSKKTNASRGSLIATGAMFLIVVLLWRDLSKSKSTLLELAEQNNRQREALATVQSELKAANKELDFFKTGDFTKTAKEKPSVAKAAPEAPVEEKETLVLQAPSLTETASGLTVRFSFDPIDSTIPGQVTLVVRVPGKSTAKILSLKPASESGYSDVTCVVDPKGKLGMIEGSPSDLNALSFELAVTGPVKALVRGSEGIKDFELDITTGGCIVRKL